MTTQQLPEPANQIQRRAIARYERGSISYEQALEVFSMQERHEQDLPLSDEQWRYIGQCNGRVF